MAEPVVRLAAVRREPLSVDELFRAVRTPSSGGIAVFVGTVRDDDHGRAVLRLEYEGHPNAEQMIELVAAEVAGRHPVQAVAAVHRVGMLEVGELAVVAAASAAHRETAFDAARDLIDEIKARVPIWKRQFFADGTTEWVGSP